MSQNVSWNPNDQLLDTTHLATRMSVALLLGLSEIALF